MDNPTTPIEDFFEGIPFEFVWMLSVGVVLVIVVYEVSPMIYKWILKLIKK